MDTFQPPLRDSFATTAEWGMARAIWFKENRKPRRKPEPQIIEREVVRTEYVEVEKIVEVERIVEVQVEAEGQTTSFDPLSEFLANERDEGESDAATLARLRAELTVLFQLEKSGPLEPVEEARKRYLTSNIKAGD